MSRISTSRDETTSGGSYQRRDSSSSYRNPFAKQKSFSKIGSELKGQDLRLEREGRLIKVNSVPVVVLDSSDAEDASSSSQYSREDTRDGRLSLDALLDVKSTRIYPSFLEETPVPTPYTSRRSAEKARKRIGPLRSSLQGSITSHSSRNNARLLVDDKEASASSHLGMDTKKRKIESNMEEKYANVTGRKVSQPVRRDQTRQQDALRQNTRSSSACASSPNTRSRPTMNTETNNDEMFDLSQSSKPSERAQRYQDKFSSMFSPRQESVKAITNSATPRLPLRHNLGAGQSSNAVSFYSQESVTTSENSRPPRKAANEPTKHDKKVKRLRLRPSVGTEKSCRRETKEWKKPECIVLDSGDDDEKLDSRVKATGGSEETMEENQLHSRSSIKGSTKTSEEMPDDKQLKTIKPLVDEDLHKVDLPLKALMIGTLWLKPTTPAVFRQDIISVQYTNPLALDRQRERCLTIAIKDISVVKSNLFNESCPTPVMALQTRQSTTLKLRSSFTMKDGSSCQYHPNSKVLAEQFIVLVLKECLEDRVQSFIKCTVEKATRQNVEWQELSKDECHTFLSNVHVGEKTETLQQDEHVHLAGNTMKQHRTRSTVNADTPQSSRRRIYKDEESDSNDDKELPSLSEDLDEPERIVLRYKSGCTYGAIGITIMTSDISLLKPTSWLNDKIVNFYLMYLYDSVLSERQKEQTYIYSTFLYEKLKEMNKKQKRHYESVSVEEDKKQLRRWTKDVDLLSKDFLVIPINQSNVHWYVVIVCYAHLAFSNTNQSNLEHLLAKRSSSVSCERSPRGRVTLNSQDNEMTSQLGQGVTFETDVASNVHIDSTKHSNSLPDSCDLLETNSTDLEWSDKELSTTTCKNTYTESNTTTSVCDSTDMNDRTANTDQNGEPSDYFRSLAGQSDLSCSDDVNLFDVPPFESSDIGCGQAKDTNAKMLSEKARSVAQRWAQVTEADGHQSGMESGSDECTSEKKHMISVSSSSQIENEESTNDSIDSAFSRSLSSRKKQVKQSRRRPNKEIVAESVEQKPCILFFDSLRSSGKKTLSAKLIRDYLTSEYQSQQPDCNFEFDSKNLPAEYPKLPGHWPVALSTAQCLKVPSQPNTCDCGVFVCQFVESFFQNPILDYRSPILLIDWFSSEFVVSHKRQELRNLIEDLGKRKDNETQSEESKHNGCR